jgi:isocitrate/isopropylmalate dehydrogenase
MDIAGRGIADPTALLRTIALLSGEAFSQAIP